MASEPTARRQDLVRIAAGEFARRGYRATTMRHIADSAGILPGSLYHHFASKEDVLRGVMTASTADFVSRLEAIAAGEGSASDRLRLALEERLELYREQGLALGVVLQTDKTTMQQSVFEPMRELGFRIEAAWDRILVSGVQSGEFDAGLDVRTTTFAIVGMVNWAHRWFNPDGRLNPAELARCWSGLILRGLERREGHA